ncbi:MAG TPA: class I SAM-dependent methyltransferase [Candidatus Eisenbacteria bacterium]|nr:class I SAM-dependent methyltransferase [Candidatus Eisenbacteria bacterium]
MSALQESVTICPCGSRDLAPAMRAFRLGETRYGLRRCRRCGRMMLDPRPGSDTLAKSYGDTYYGTGSRKFIPAIEGVVDWFRDGRARLAGRLVAESRRDGTGTVLDIGCGSGQFLARLARSGHECHGTEYSAETGRRASKVPGLHLVFGALGADTFAAGTFDLISIWHVLEHLPDPDSVLRYCHRWLGEGGTLMIAVPNGDSLQAKLFGGSWFHLDPPRHLYHFTRESMRRALADAGFRIQRMRTLSWEQNVYGILQSILNVIGFPRDEFYEVLKGNRPLRRSPRLLLQFLLMTALAPVAFVLTGLEALFGRGGTLECIARRADAALR